MAMLALAMLALPSLASAQQLFKTSEEAVEALVNAVKTGDRNAILTVLGRDAADIVSSGDQVADAATRQEFLAAYQKKHQVTPEGDNAATLALGPDDFPFPIPLVRRNGMWMFDTAAGRLEILYRRIGRNELDAIQVCLAYVDAQNEYADQDRTGAGPGVYAQHFVSRPGKKDGLYWPASQGADESPLGALFALASREGYRVGPRPIPFRGYYFRILTKQGSNVPGGALDYVVNGKMIGGFALVAYPAEYGNSGVMTFMVNHNGKIWEKDLGPDTSRLAGQITSYNPDQTWRMVEVADSE
jgi:hypothetical protein